MKLLRKYIPTALVALSLVASPVAAQHFHGGNHYHGGYNRGGGHFGTGLALGLGVGALGGYSYGRTYYPRNDYNYYGYVPDCPSGSYLARDAYDSDRYVCVYR